MKPLITHTEHYVGFWPRAFAQLIDSLLCAVFLVPVVWLEGWAVFRPGHIPSLMHIVMGYLLPGLGLLALWLRFQSSPGKYLAGARIVDADSEGDPAPWQMAVRLLGYALSFMVFGLGFFWALLDARRQTWHDKLARTVVVPAVPRRGSGFRLLTPPRRRQPR